MGATRWPRVVTWLRPAAALALMAAPGSQAMAQVDHPCIESPSFPADCVAQLGAIGEPPAEPALKDWRHVVSPVGDPLLRVAGGPADGLLYAIHPSTDSVRVFDPAGGGLTVVADVPVCARPSALAQNADGTEVLVACHASHAVGVIATSQQRMVDVIQDRDEAGRPRLQEPMAMVVVGETLYVASSQNHRVAAIDLPERRVQAYFPVPGQEPRALAATPDGRFLIVANFLAGNRTEPDIVLDGNIFQPGNVAGERCAPLLDDPAAAAIIDEAHPDFMDTGHPDYPLLAECYFFGHRLGETHEVVINPARPDHDLVVLSLPDGAVVSTSDDLTQDLGTLNYAVAVNQAGTRVWLATVHARNALGSDFGNRPMVNRLAVLDLDPVSGSLTPVAVHDLDAPFLDANGNGTAVAATPFALAVQEDRVVLAAAGSDRLVLTDLDGQVTGTVPTGFGPKGLVVDGPIAWVYNATGLDVWRVDMATGQHVADAGLGPDPMPQSQRIGARLFDSAGLSSNGTFSCASCHPDGHLDGLVWKLDEADGLRTTMTLQEIGETAPYHWGGEKCNLVKILQDGIVNLFGDPDGPTPCETKTLIDFMQGLVRPHSPHRAPDDSMSSEAELGLLLIGRTRFKRIDGSEADCNGRQEDPVAEALYLDALGDPRRETFVFDGGGGLLNNTGNSETCSTASCHASPHWESLGTSFGIQAVSVLGTWDRMATMHDARTTRWGLVRAMEISRQQHGAPPVLFHDQFSGELATRQFHDIHFRHPEFNVDGDPQTHAWMTTDALSRFVMEEEQLQPGAFGLTLALDHTGLAAPDDAGIAAWLQAAADQGKIVLRGVGLWGGSPVGLAWEPAASVFRFDGGGSADWDALLAGLVPGDSLVLFGAMLPGQTGPNPKLEAVQRATSPVPCYEGSPSYLAGVTTGEQDVPLLLRGHDVQPSSHVLIDGQVTGQPLSGPGPTWAWTLPQAPETPGALAVPLMSPVGMLSNSRSLPVIAPVVPPTQPLLSVAAGAELRWDDQFGLTGPGTRYDVWRGTLAELHGDEGLAGGKCHLTALDQPVAVDAEPPDVGGGFYYVVRAQNPEGASGWGSDGRDAAIAAGGSCALLFP